MKHIYFVRHGEIDSNVHEYMPTKDESLNSRGIRQAQLCAERSRSINFTKLVASDFTRAQQTAAPIAVVKNLEIETIPLFGEFVEPSSLFGLSYQDERVQIHRKERNKNIENSEWRSEDGENFSDVFKRVTEARHFLESDTAVSILVVSHALFLQLFVTAILLDIKEPTDKWFQLALKLQMSNTGITLLSFDENKWKLIMWNDHAHFAE